MALTLSAVLLFGILLILLIKTGSLKPGGALVAVLFGFYLASTGLSSPVRQLTAVVLHGLNTLF
jgi:hypothetical protein